MKSNIKFPAYGDTVSLILKIGGKCSQKDTFNSNNKPVKIMTRKTDWWNFHLYNYICKFHANKSCEGWKCNCKLRKAQTDRMIDGFRNRCSKEQIDVLSGDTTERQPKSVFPTICTELVSPPGEEWPPQRVARALEAHQKTLPNISPSRNTPSGFNEREREAKTNKGLIRVLLVKQRTIFVRCAQFISLSAATVVGRPIASEQCALSRSL
jgi:hypothetical protein